jgi:hypothetical protein
MTPHHLLEHATQRLEIERAAQAQRRRHVVRARARLELLEEPQALLGERQRQETIARHGHQRRQRHRGARAPRRLDPRRQTGDGGRLEDGADGQLDGEGGAQARGQLHGQ